MVFARKIDNGILIPVHVERRGKDRRVELRGTEAGGRIHSVDERHLVAFELLGGEVGNFSRLAFGRGVENEDFHG